MKQVKTQPHNGIIQLRESVSTMAYDGTISTAELISECECYGLSQTKTKIRPLVVLQRDGRSYLNSDDGLKALLAKVKHNGESE